MKDNRDGGNDRKDGNETRHVCLALQVVVVVLQRLEVAMITLSSQLGSTRKIPRRVSLAFQVLRLQLLKRR